MKIECPKNSKHDRFKTSTAHVQQEWEVDSSGDYVHTITECLDVDHYPDGGDLFTCIDCGSKAKVEED